MRAGKVARVAIAVKNARDLRVEVGIGDDRGDGAVEGNWRITPQVGGTASRKACIRRAGVRCSAKPSVRKKRLSRSSVMALVMLSALITDSRR